MGGAHGGARQEDPLLRAAGKIVVAPILKVQDLQSLYLFTGPLFFHTGNKKASVPSC